MARCMLLITDKQTYGPERTEYRSVECIRQAFVDAVRRVDNNVDPGKWSTTAFDEPATPTVVANDRQCLSLEELQDPARLLKNDGFEMGMLVREKGSVSKATYKIVDIGDRVRLCETDPLGEGDKAFISVPLETFFAALGDSRR